VLDEIIPPSGDGRLPGAGELGIGRYLEEKAGPLRPLLAQKLAALDEHAGRSGGQSFASLAHQERLALLGEMATSEPVFFQSVVFLTYASYYQSARVIAALGLPVRPPHPEGYEVEPGDLSLLDAVRARPKLYREV
jgi:hypothetical protein